MTAAELIIAIVLFVISGILMLLGIRSFAERGFVLNNAYIFASEQERKRMNKKPYYRQTAVVFFLLSAIFTIIGSSVVLQNQLIGLLDIPVVAGALIYAVVSSLRIGKEEKK